MKECSVCRHCFPDDFNNCPTDGDALSPSIAGSTVLDGRYQLEMRLGQGGMGIVYKARHVFLKTSYAIKVILPDLVGNDPMLVTRFRQEAMVAARIGHKNIVNVTDFGVVSGKMPYLVMDLIEGKSLHDLLLVEGHFNTDRALELMSALCAGIGAAHKQGVIHRDLKPLNVMVQNDRPIDDAVKVLDFGLAKIKSGELLGSFIAAQTTGLMGSPYYMAPEQWSDEEPDARADIYSLGVIMYQMLAGEVPFKGSTIPAIMKKHLYDPPPPFATRGIRVAQPIEAVVRHALAKNRDHRIASVSELMRDLRAANSLAFDSLGMTQPPLAGDTESATMQFMRDDITSARGFSPDTVMEASVISESRQQIEDEADRLTREFEEAQRRADEARRRAEEAARKRAEEEAERRRAEEEAARKLAEEEAARKLAEDMARKAAEEEAARRLAEQEAARQLAEELERKRAEEERERQRIAEEAARLAREVAEAQERAEEARLRADEEARKRTEEAAARKRAEEEAQRLAHEVAEAERRAEAARVRAELETKKRAEEEEQRRLEEEEDERKRAEETERILHEEEERRKRAAEEADRLSHEVSAAQIRADEARLRAEEESQKRVEAEEALKRAEEEARKLLHQVAEAQRRAEERKRADEEERRAELEAQRLKAASEEAASDDFETVVADLRPDEKGRRSASIPKSLGSVPSVDAQSPSDLDQAIGEIDFSETKKHATHSTQQLGETSWQTGQAIDGSIAPAVKKKSPTLLIVGIAAVVLVSVIGVTALFLGKQFFGSSTTQPSTTGTTTGGTTKPQVTETPVNPSKGEQVKIEGGSFMMGLSNVSSKIPYDLAQSPAHQVEVNSFWIDKTEVTNAEYADFVSATKHASPSSWRDNKPPKGEERWPVTYVSFADAQAFAEWRSKRDGFKYRLPNEEEWEFVARNGAQATTYPWGNQWLDDRANVEANAVKSVGSYPLGASSSGVLDLIGNVWEWTSSPSKPYPGNASLILPNGQLIIRGGAYVENSRGADAITATRRSWVPPTAKEAAIGFRLVRTQ